MYRSICLLIISLLFCYEKSFSDEIIIDTYCMERGPRNDLT